MHEKIIDYAGRPNDHEAMMVKRWKHKVKEGNRILHLGDVFFGGDKGYENYILNIMPHLPGKKYLILGNHDKRKFDYARLGFTVIKPFSIMFKGYEVSFDHYPKLIHTGDKRRIHVHGHTHSNPYSSGDYESWGNINVSVEVIDYRPVNCSKLLTTAINGRRKGNRYRNVPKQKIKHKN